jgi:hypothetical protein
MALDYMAIASQGVYPTPTPPTMAIRVALACSQGLLNVTLPTGSVAVVDTFFKLIKGGAKLFTTGARIFLRR